MAKFLGKMEIGALAIGFVLIVLALSSGTSEKCQEKFSEGTCVHILR